MYIETLDHQPRPEAIAVDAVGTIDEARASGVVATVVEIEATTAADSEVVTGSGCGCVVPGGVAMVSYNLHGHRLARIVWQRYPWLSILW